MKHLFIIVYLFLSFTVAIFAATPKISAEKHYNIIKLIELSGEKKSEETMLQHMEEIMRNAPGTAKEKEITNKFLDALNLNDLTELMVPVYDKYFDDKELAAAISFYSSPAGQKMAELRPMMVTNAIGMLENVWVQMYNAKNSHANKPQEQNSNTQAKMSPKQKAIYELLEVTGQTRRTDEIYRKICYSARNMKTDVPVTKDSLMNVFVNLYDNYLDEQTIKDLTKFYKSADGISLLSKEEKIQAEIGKVGAKYGARLRQNVIQNIKSDNKPETKENKQPQQKQEDNKQILST